MSVKQNAPVLKRKMTPIKKIFVDKMMSIVKESPTQILPLILFWMVSLPAEM